MYSSMIFLERSSIFRDKRLHRLTFLRHMGGGPRTFPGGLNKWQWKRLHEKQARQKERRLIDQEKDVYQARVRSAIRSQIHNADPYAHEQNVISPNYMPISPKEHIKALADRFMRQGAEDLWNEADGPISSPSPQQKARIESNHDSINLRRVISGQNYRGNNQVNEISSGLGYNKWSTRHYSVDLYSDNRYRLLNARHYSVRTTRFRRRKNESSASEDNSDDDEAILLNANIRENWKGRPLGYIGSSLNKGSDGDDVDDDGGNRRKKKMMMSSAALRTYGTKSSRRIRLNAVEKEDNLSLHVQAIRNDFNKRRMAEKDIEMDDDDPIPARKRFEECNISLLTIKALTLAGFVKMTKVQDATISACLDGKDVLVKANARSGKIAAYLVPAIETILKPSVNNTVKQLPPIDVLILCPTREVASQITAEAKLLLKYHEGIGVQRLVGGIRFKFEQKRLETEPCHIIVANPGRLLDHIENKSGFSARLMRLKMFIVDEANQLLNLGFRKDIEKIVDCIPRKRQALLFSASLPIEVQRLSQLVLKRGHDYISAVGLVPETHNKVNQSYLIAPHEQHFQIVHHLLKDHILQVPNYKVIVFCTTAMMASVMFSLLSEMKMNVKEVHSGRPQLVQNRVSEESREAKQLILITSDVSARGLNYPDVTLVIQVGIPVDRGQYINRLGGIGRGDKLGEGILLLAPWEEYFLEEIKDLPLLKISSPHLDPNMKIQIEKSMAKVDQGVKVGAYNAWLSYYNSIREIGRDKTTLAQLAKSFCDTIRLEKVPALDRKTVLKRGLQDIPGIRVRR